MDIRCEGWRNLLHSDNWSRKGKNRYNEIGKKLQSMRANNAIHKAHVEAWHNFNKREELFPLPQQHLKDEELFDPNIHGRRTFKTRDPATIPLLANCDFDNTKIFEI